MIFSARYALRPTSRFLWLRINYRNRITIHRDHFVPHSGQIQFALWSTWINLSNTATHSRIGFFLLLFIFSFSLIFSIKKKGNNENYRSKPKCEWQALSFDYMKKKGVFYTIFQPIFVSLGRSKNWDCTAFSKSPNNFFYDSKWKLFFQYFFSRHEGGKLELWLASRATWHL